MPLAPPTRVNYFDRQFIRLAELKDEQAYHLEIHRRHNLSHHSWGIVIGLEIVKEQDGRPALRPGLAVDGYGRELLLLERRVINREDFDRYGTSRLDLWLEYELEFADDRLAPVECGETDPRRRYRAIERAHVAMTRGGALPDPRRPPGVPADVLAQDPSLSTSDDPRDRWPVYLGRIIMVLPPSGPPEFTVDTADRVYAGLNAAAIDHPGNASRIELGLRPQHPETRTIDGETVEYQRGPQRDFAVFVPGTDKPLEPVLAVDNNATHIRGDATVHGNLILDGASLQFPDNSDGHPSSVDSPTIYRTTDGSDELRIDMGSQDAAKRRLVIGATKDGKFMPALEVAFVDSTGPAPTSAIVTVYGDLRIMGTVKSPDVRTRTVTEEVAALLTGMVQAGIASGS
jgi:hypothetical protein